MNFNEALQFAFEKSKILRERKNPLYTFGSTRLPYICLSESPDDSMQVQVRKGEVTAEPPRIAVPGKSFHFEGFDFDDNTDEEMAQILLARRIQIPPARYVNTEDSNTLQKGSLEATADRTLESLDKSNDSRTAVIAAPAQVWNLSILIYVGNQVIRSAPSNVAEHFERLRFQGEG